MFFTTNSSFVHAKKYHSQTAPLPLPQRCAGYTVSTSYFTFSFPYPTTRCLEAKITNKDSREYTQGLMTDWQAEELQVKFWHMHMICTYFWYMHWCTSMNRNHELVHCTSQHNKSFLIIRKWLLTRQICGHVYTTLFCQIVLEAFINFNILQTMNSHDTCLWPVRTGNSHNSRHLVLIAYVAHPHKYMLRYIRPPLGWNGVEREAGQHQ